jgi:hypothetical protein
LRESNQAPQGCSSLIIHNEAKRVEYVNGQLLEESKYSAPADSPITGTWKYVVYSGSGYEIGGLTPPSVLRTATFIYSQNGIVESIHQNSLTTSSIKGNWKYIPKTPSSGVLEEYRGEDLIERGTVKWLGQNQLEFTITFSHNSDAIGNQSVWTRQ